MRVSKAVFLVSILLAVTLSSFANGTSETGSERPPATSAPPQTRKATVSFVEGIALVNGSAVDFGDVLPLKFVVRTEKGARLDIVFDGGNALSVAQNAIVDIDLSSLAPIVALEQGGVTSVLKKLEKIAQGDSFNVRTAQAVMGVRGTSFCVWADAESTYVCACNGEVRTIDAKGNHEETLTAAHHVARLFTRKGGGLSVEEVGLLHHTDESVESVAARIGYAIDWSTVDR